MAQLPVFSLGGLQTNSNPVGQNPGDFIRLVNIESYPFDAKRKRIGYQTYLNAPDANSVNTLFDWHRNDGTTFWNYRASGSLLYYSIQGTGAWTVCGNGTIANGAHVGNTVLEDTLIIGDGIGSTRHSTDGTSFTNTSGAPIAQYFSEYQQRIWAGGTSSNLFYSTTGTASDWITDSSSILVPGPGRINSVIKSNDRLNITKNSGAVFKYDGIQLLDLAVNTGPSSSYSIGSIQDNRVWLNRKGVFTYNGAQPTLISNPIERQIYNKNLTGIIGTNFDNAPGIVHNYDYFCAVGTVTDDFTRETVNNCILKYNFLKGDWTNYTLANNPTAWLSFKDNTQTQQLIFGDANGNTFIFNDPVNGNLQSDNTLPIPTVLEFMVSGKTISPKDWKRIRLAFNPGCEAQVQVAVANSYPKEARLWQNLGDAISGVVNFHFPADSRGVYLFGKISDNSNNSNLSFYGYEVDFDILPDK